MNNRLQLPIFINTINETNLSFDDFTLNERKIKDNYIQSNTVAMDLKLSLNEMIPIEYRHSLGL